MTKELYTEYAAEFRNHVYNRTTEYTADDDIADIMLIYNSRQQLSIEDLHPATIALFETWSPFRERTAEQGFG